MQLRWTTFSWWIQNTAYRVDHLWFSDRYQRWTFYVYFILNARFRNAGDLIRSNNIKIFSLINSDWEFVQYGSKRGHRLASGCQTENRSDNRYSCDKKAIASRHAGEKRQEEWQLRSLSRLSRNGIEIVSFRSSSRSFDATWMERSFL